VGSAVTNRKVGQIVGVGWQRSACGQCYNCLRADDNLCETKEETCTFGQIGGFAEIHHTKARYAIPIPSGIPLEAAGPLMCCGITTFSPFIDYNIRPIHKVGIIGIGGLGHMAIQWASKWGCDVTAFSTSASKKQEVTQFGAHRFVVYSGSQVNKEELGTQVEELKKQLDFILVTIPYKIETDFFLPLLKATGSIIYLAGGMNSVEVTPVDLFVGNRKTVAGDNTGNLANLYVMLEFAARHNIKPMVEVVKIDDIHEAVEKVRQNKMKYRMVVAVHGQTK